MNTQILIGVFSYVAIVVAVGLWYTRRSNSGAEEYFIGKRGLNPWVTAMSAEASDMSGWLLMGLPGVAYYTGCGEAFWTALGLALGTWFNWRFVAKRLRTYSQIADNAITLPEFFSKRFHDKRHILISFSAVLILFFFSIYVGSQFVTFGKLFVYIFNAEGYYTAMVIFGAVVLMLYTLFGGFLAVCMTDLIQGFMMFFALLAVLICGFAVNGGFAGVGENLSRIPRFLDIFGLASPEVAGGVVRFGAGKDYSLLNIVSCFAWGLGYFGMPQVLIRFMAIEHTAKLKQSRFIAVIFCFVSLFAAVSIGLIGRAWRPELFQSAAASENIFLYMTVDFFPPLLAGIALSGILAASMSSSDSYMLTASSSLANDLFKTFFKKASEATVMWVARVTILIVTIFGTLIALSGNNSIFRIVSYAWAGLGASFGPLVLFSLFWKRMTLAGACAGMLSGGLMVIVWKNIPAIWRNMPIFWRNIFSVYELLPAFIVSCLVIITVSLISKPPSASIVKEFETTQTAEL